MSFSKVNTKSLVVIPKAIRDKAGISPGDYLNIEYDSEGKEIIMRKVEDLGDLSREVFGMWKNNDFEMKAKVERLSADERIEKLLKRKLQQKGAP